MTRPAILPDVEKHGTLIGAVRQQPVEMKSRSKFRVLLLPTGSDKVIVQYHPNFVISCVQPAQTVPLNFVRYGGDSSLEGKKKLPPLLWTCTFAQNVALRGAFSGKGRLTPHYQLHTVDLKRNDKVWAKPYVLPNVYNGTGNICWGGTGYPRDLRQANSLFWSTPFNGDLSSQREPESLKKSVQSYKCGGSYEDKTALVCGNRWVACREHVDGVLASSNKTLLKKVPASDHHDVIVVGGNGRETVGKVVIALGNRLRDGSWGFTTGNYVFRLAADKVKFEKVGRGR